MAQLLDTVQELSEWDLIQERSLAEIISAFESGKQAVVGAAPTGFGKTKLAMMLITRWAQENGMPWVFYTHRRSLFAQTHNVFLRNGIKHGCRAAGYWQEEQLDCPGQMAMLQTEAAACPEKRQLHDAKLVIVDEAHANRAGKSEGIIRHHLDAGAFVFGLSATPVGLGHIYDELIHLCMLSELRKVGGALVASVYAPDEVDVSGVVKTSKDGEYSQAELARRFAAVKLIGRVYDWWIHLNPNRLATILFAPGVKESMGFVDELRALGVKAAHVDGEDTYFGEKDADDNPVLYKSSQKKREELFEKSKTGEIEIICNRFVLREGIDLPHLYHAIFATAFASEESWVQSVGRVLRSHESLGHVLVQDHGGNVWRPGLGSPNADRVWELTDTNSSRAKDAKEAMEEPQAEEDAQPKGCPQCRAVINEIAWMKNGKKCPVCQFKFSKSVRFVEQTDGRLVKVDGNAVKLKKKYAEGQKAWEKIFWSSKNSKSAQPNTMKQLRARFHREYPQYYIDVSGAKTMVVNRSTNERAVLGNVPEPNSAEWNRPARVIHWKDLQKKEAISAGASP